MTKRPADDMRKYAESIAEQNPDLAQMLVQAATKLEVEAIEKLADGFSGDDVGNAGRFVKHLNGRARYVQAWDKWAVYSDGAWKVDVGDTLVTRLAEGVQHQILEFIHTNSEMSEDARDKLRTQAYKCGQLRNIRSFISLARGRDGVNIDVDSFDQHHFLLNVANGTIDLHSGEFLDFDKNHLLTKKARVSYEAEAQCPKWLECLETWQPDPEVRDYLQEVAGSALTGHPVQFLFVNVGRGANGKSVFYGVLQRLLGPYAAIADKSLFIGGQDQHKTVKATLFGSRLVVAAETRSGAFLDEESVKKLTGGDRIDARRMREDEWSFEPHHTAFMHTNHKPRVREGDEATWRRLKLIHWNTVIPPDQRNENLLYELLLEGPGVLLWLLEGAKRWLDRGMRFIEPESIRLDTNQYRADEDHIGRFVEACCTVGEGLQTKASDLRMCYENYCRSEGEKAWSAKAMAPHLQRLGFESKRAKTGMVWLGFKPNSAEDVEFTITDDTVGL